MGCDHDSCLIRETLHGLMDRVMLGLDAAADRDGRRSVLAELFLGGPVLGVMRMEDGSTKELAPTDGCGSAGMGVYRAAERAFEAGASAVGLVFPLRPPAAADGSVGVVVYSAVDGCLGGVAGLLLPDAMKWLPMSEAEVGILAPLLELAAARLPELTEIPVELDYEKYNLPLIDGE